MIRYSGGTYVNTTFVASGTKQDLANNIETALLAAGFTTVSGSGTTNLLMQSAATPFPHQMRFRFKAQNTSVTVSIENVSGSIAGTNTTTGGVSLTPRAGNTWRVVANKYQFVIFVVGEPSVLGEFVFGCVPFVPTFLTATYVGILLGSKAGDNDASTYTTWRTNLISGSNYGSFQVVWDATKYDYNVAGNPGIWGAAHCKRWIQVPGSLHRGSHA